MDATPANALKVILSIGAPIRVPTACWVLIDVFNITDHKARNLLQALAAEESITIDNGGWIQ